MKDIGEEYRGDGMTLSRPWIACLKLATGLVVRKLRLLVRHGTIRPMDIAGGDGVPFRQRLVVIRELFNSVWNSI